MDIDNMLNVVRRDNTIVDALNKLPIREYGRKKIDQTSKYTTLNRGAYYVHHDWGKNQKAMNKVEVYLPLYEQDGCYFKLIMQAFI